MEKSIPSPTINFRAQPPLDYWRGVRAGAGESPTDVARRDSPRYYQLLLVELRGLRLDRTQASLLCDALNGVWLGDGGWQLLPLHVVDALTDDEDELAAKWQVDGPALAAAARRWTPGQRAALADAVTRFWRSTALDEPIQEVLQEVGLIGPPGLKSR